MSSVIFTGAFGLTVTLYVITKLSRTFSGCWSVKPPKEGSSGKNGLVALSGICVKPLCMDELLVLLLIA
jgi:hypothetical protein